jgi:enoyl-CoA hydratase/carnithine racemase
VAGELINHAKVRVQYWRRRTAMADPLVLYDVDDKVGIITLNRPDKLNAISHELQAALTKTFARADADPATSVVLLRAEGRSFCAGYDIGAKDSAPTIGAAIRPRRMRICSRSSNSK